MSATECCRSPTAWTQVFLFLHVSLLPHYRRRRRHPQVVSQRQKPRRAATRRSVMPTVLGRTGKSGTHRRAWVGGGGGGGGDDERRIYLVVVLKARQPSVRQQHFSRRDGEGVTLVKYLGAPPPPPTRPLACHGSVGFLPGDLSVTLSRCIAIQGLWRVPQPDHEIGQLSCLPHPSTSSRSGDGTV